MKGINVAELRQTLAEVLNRAGTRGERIRIQRRGKDVAAIVSIEDLELLERLIAEEEDRIDLAASDAALADPSDRIPYAEFRRQMGLGDGDNSPLRNHTRRRSAAPARKNAGRRVRSD
jgi:prevent-host-death family protein